VNEEQSPKRDLAAEFEAAYSTTPPWDIGRPQPAFASLAAEGGLGRRVLDVGCGTGEHVLMAAEAGRRAVGIDISPTAIRLAEAKAAERGTGARFTVGDVRRLEALGERFDTVLDCGLFHMFDPDDRAAYVASLCSATRPGARYFMLCFSDRQPGNEGPHRLTRAEITTAFADGWRLDAIEPATIEVTIDPDGIRAWSVAATRN
jgi:cyclopropane fatty-acyl-phospholipid synthase-like methyltransferase